MLIPARRDALRPILTTLGAILLSSAIGQAASQEMAAGPALWTLQDEDTTIHLFGLPGFVSEQTVWRTARLDTVFDDADLVVFEADRTSEDAQTAMQAAVVEQGLLRDGRSLADTVDAALYERVEVAADALGLPLQAIRPLKPWLVSVQLGAFNLQQQGWTVAPPPAAVIAQTARQTGAELRYLEQPGELLGRMARLPDEVHAGMLEQAVLTLETRPEEPAGIVAAWSRGDVEALADLYHGPGAWADERLRQTMLVERNAAWTDAVSDMMAAETGIVLVAVGAGHLVGEDSLIRGLEARGYTVTRR